MTHLPCAYSPLWVCCERASVFPGGEQGGGAGKGDTTVASRTGPPALYPQHGPWVLDDEVLDVWDYFPLAGKPKASP